MREVDFQSEYHNYVLGIVEDDVLAAKDEIWLSGRSIQSTREILFAYFRLGAPKGIDPVVSILKPLFLAGDDPEVRTLECKKVIQDLVESYCLKMATAFRILLKDEEVGKVEVLTFLFDILKSLEGKSCQPLHRHKVHQFLKELNLESLFRNPRSGCEMIIIEIVTYFDFEIENFMARVLTLGSIEEVEHFGKNAHCLAVIYLVDHLRSRQNAKKTLLLFANLNLDFLNIRPSIYDTRLYDKFPEMKKIAFELIGPIATSFLRERDIEGLNCVYACIFSQYEHQPQISFFPEGEITGHSPLSVLILYLLQNPNSSLEARIVVLNSLTQYRADYLEEIFKPIYPQVKKILQDEKALTFTVRKVTALFIIALVEREAQKVDDIVNALRSWRRGTNKNFDRLVKELLMVISGSDSDSFLIYLRGLCEQDIEYFPCLAEAVKY